MNLKGLAIATTLIAAPIGATAATVAAKNQKAETQITQQAPDYQLSSQDYKTYVLPQFAASSTTNKELAMQDVAKAFLSQTEERRDSIINETFTKSLSAIKNYNNRMDSIQNAADTRLEELSDKIINAEFKATNLDKVLADAENEQNIIMNLYNKMNEIDSETNGAKAVEALPEADCEEIAENTLGMSLEEFESTYADELASLKDREIPMNEPIPSPYMLTEKERFVLDKINELNINLNTEFGKDYLKASNNTVARSEKTIDEVYSAISKLNDFNRTEEYSDFEDFVENESEIVVKAFLDEIQKLSDTPSGITSVSADKQNLPSVRKYVEDGKVIIEVTNPNDQSVKKYTTNGMEVK